MAGPIIRGARFEPTDIWKWAIFDELSGQFFAGWNCDDKCPEQVLNGWQLNAQCANWTSSPRFRWEVNDAEEAYCEMALIVQLKGACERSLAVRKVCLV